MQFDGPAFDQLRSRAKVQIRARMRALRGAVPAESLAVRSRAIVERLLALPELGGGARIASFWPMLERGEVDLRGLDAALRAGGAILHYPYMERAGQTSLGFARVDSVESLEAGTHGFLAPPEAADEARPGGLDVLVVPALAVSADGHRIGYGAGFYDRVLPGFRPPALAVVVAYEFQLLGELPFVAGDVAVDIVVTDGRVIRCGEPR